MEKKYAWATNDRGIGASKIEGFDPLVRHQRISRFTLVRSIINWVTGISRSWMIIINQLINPHIGTVMLILILVLYHRDTLL